MSELRPIPAPWDGVALVCKKCSRKLGGGFGRKGKQDLSKVLRATLKETGRRRALRVIEVGCLNLCPKRAVTVIGPALPGQVLAVPEGTDPAAVLAAISPPAASAPAPGRPR